MSTSASSIGRLCEEDQGMGKLMNTVWARTFVEQALPARNELGSPQSQW